MSGDKTVPRREIYVCCFPRWLYCQTEFQYYVYTHRLVLFNALIREGFFLQWAVFKTKTYNRSNCQV